MNEQRFGFARKTMPSKCPDCGLKMSEVKYDNKHWRHLWGSASAPRHYRECACGCLVVWAYPAVFQRRHILPLFDDKQILMVVDK